MLSLLVLSLKVESHGPCRHCSRCREARTACKCQGVSSSITIGPKILRQTSANRATISKMVRTYRCPDETDVGSGNNQSHGDGTLFLGLSAGSTDPSEDNAVDSVCTNGENDHADIARCNIIDSE